MANQPPNSSKSPSDGQVEEPPPSSSNPSPTKSSPPPPSPSTNPPEEDPPDNAPPPSKSPETPPSPPPTPSQEPPDDLPPPPPSEDQPPNSIAPPITTPPPNSSPTQPSADSPPPLNSPPALPYVDSPPPPPSEDSPPSPPSEDSPPSGSPPSPLSSGSPPSFIPLPLPSRSPPSPSSISQSLILSSPPVPGISLVPPGAPPASSSNNESGIGTTGFLAIGLVSGFVFLVVTGFLFWWLCHRKKTITAAVGSSLGSYSQSESALGNMRFSPAYASSGSGRESASGSSKNWYSYEELARATSEFSESNLLGEGGFGSVFKGRLPDGREVAVKQLKDGGGQGEREFRAEVETIRRIHHRHLVSLAGYCIFNDKRLLVYDYVPNNTLHFHLHGNCENVLDWPARIKIATGAARGINYLHEDCHPRIVHRDIKSSNILLQNNFEAQVSDFGLARLFSDAHTHVTTRVMGTFGYMSPEYASSGMLTEKSDVFSFGVVLLELITGRKPVDTSQPLGEESLVELARPLLHQALENEKFEILVDPRLGENYVASEMFRVIEVAAACVRYSALKRPKMSKILRALDDMSHSDLTNRMKVGESEFIDFARQSAEMKLFRRMAFGSQDYSTTSFVQGDSNTEEK